MSRRMSCRERVGPHLYFRVPQTDSTTMVVTGVVRPGPTVTSTPPLVST